MAEPFPMLSSRTDTDSLRYLLAARNADPSGRAAPTYGVAVTGCIDVNPEGQPA